MADNPILNEAEIIGTRVAVDKVADKATEEFLSHEAEAYGRVFSADRMSSVYNPKGVAHDFYDPRIQKILGRRIAKDANLRDKIALAKESVKLAHETIYPRLHGKAVEVTSRLEPYYSKVVSATRPYFDRAANSEVAQAVVDRISRMYSSLNGVTPGVVTSLKDAVARYSSVTGDAVRTSAERLSKKLGLKISKNRYFKPSRFWEYAKPAVKYPTAAAEWLYNKGATGAKTISKYSGKTADFIEGATRKGVNNLTPIHITKSHAISNFVKNALSKQGMATGWAVGGVWQGLKGFYELATDSNLYNNEVGGWDHFRTGEVVSRFINDSARVASDWVLLGIPRLIPGVSSALDRGEDYDYTLGAAGEDEYLKKVEYSSNMIKQGIDPLTNKRIRFREGGKVREITDEEIQRGQQVDRYLELKRKRREDTAALLKQGNPDVDSVRYFLRTVRNERDSMVNRVEDNYRNFDAWIRTQSSAVSHAAPTADAYRKTALANVQRKYLNEVSKVVGTPAASATIEQNRAAAFNVFTGGYSDPSGVQTEVFNRLWDSYDPEDKLFFNVNKFRDDVITTAKNIRDSQLAAESVGEDPSVYPVGDQDYGNQE